MGDDTGTPTRTAANGVIYHTKRQYRPTQSAPPTDGPDESAPPKPVYAYVDVPASHPFTTGTTVHIGNGRTMWTVTESRPTGVTLQSPASRHRSIDYGALADLTIIPASD